MRTRNNKITFYLNDRELAKIDAMVDKTNMNREQFIRAMLEGLTIKEAPPAPLWQTVCRMKQAAEDLKVIAENSYLSDFSDEALLRKTITDVQTCVREVTKLCLPEEKTTHGFERKRYRTDYDMER